MYEDHENMNAEMKLKKWSPGYLYILDYGDGETFKIGITSGDPSLRSNQVTRNVGALVPNHKGTKLLISLEMSTNPYYLEQLVHMSLADHHEVGEWFKLSIDQLADLVGRIKPFGYLEYYDGWYELFEDDFIGYVVNGAYPMELEYREGVAQYSQGTDWLLITDKDRMGEAEKVQASFKELQQLHPDSFDNKAVSISCWP